MSEFDSSQKIVKCKVSRLGETPTAKYIEIEIFKAWAYIMFHRHGLEAFDMSLHLWVDLDEYESRRIIYDKLDPPEAVDRIQLMISCETSSACHTVVRFSAHEEVDKIKEILLSHLCEEIRGRKTYQFVVTPGNIFHMRNESEGFLLGLEGSNRYTLF